MAKGPPPHYIISGGGRLSPSDIPMLFKPHGSYRMLIGKNVLLHMLIGSYNYEIAQVVSRRVKEALSLEPRQAVFIDNRRWGLMTPEAAEVLRDLNKWTIEFGLRRNAHVVTSSMYETLIERNLHPNTDQYIRRYFLRPEDATRWLAREGYPVLEEELDELYEASDLEE